MKTGSEPGRPKLLRRESINLVLMQRSVSSKGRHRRAIVGILLMFLTYSCASNQVSIPNLEGADVDTAKTTLSALGLVPAIREFNSPTLEKGKVIGSNPKAGKSAERGSRVVISISKGPARVDSKSSTLSWRNISWSGQDNWKFFAPYIENNTLKIVAHPTFRKNIEWKDPYDTGSGFGNASLKRSFSPSVPLKFVYETQRQIAGKEQEIKIEIPLANLNNDRPTNVYMQLYAVVGGTEIGIGLSLSLSW